MFAKLFSSNGLSLDRLRSLLEVRAAGGIARAAMGDAVRQSQYSRQIKELEDFFGVTLLERHGRGVRLTPNGLELARIARFFLLGLSNFQRGCHAEEQTVRVGASATVIQHLISSIVAARFKAKDSPRFALEGCSDEEIERRLHDLTLSFGVVRAAVSRPLQTALLGEVRVRWWVPGGAYQNPRAARKALVDQHFPSACVREWPDAEASRADETEAAVVCDSFIDAFSFLREGTAAVPLPGFMDAEASGVQAICADENAGAYGLHLAWNPRSLRLNPSLVKLRDFMVTRCSDSLRQRI